MKFIYIGINIPDMSSSAGGFYADLLRGLAENYEITILAPALNDGFTGIRKEGNCRVLRVKSKLFIGNIKIWKKGIRLILLSNKYIRAYDKYLKDEKFDVVFMSTPPMNFVDVFKHIKKRSNAKGYLILRDIHPECLDRRKISNKAINNNLVIDEARKPYTVNALIKQYLKQKAKKLYGASDIIGCMSPGNCDYIQTIYPNISSDTFKVLPNWYSGNEHSYDINVLHEIKRKYELENKFIAIFGGTIGEAQAIWNIVALAKHNIDNQDIVFLVVGRGSKKNKLQEIAQCENLTNIRIIDYLPREDYENLLAAADIGLISIDEKYSVPTCPSKIIGYMALGKPVLAIFNKGNDYGEYYIDKAKCGFWSADLNYVKYFRDFDKLYLDSNLREQLGNNGYEYFKENLTVENAVKNIITQIHE